MDPRTQWSRAEGSAALGVPSRSPQLRLLCAARPVSQVERTPWVKHTQWTHIRTPKELQAAHHKGTGHTKSHVLFQSQEGICVGLTSSEPGQLLAHTELLRVTAHTRPHTGQPRVDPGKTQPTGRAVTPHPTSTLSCAAPMLASVKAILRSFLFYALHVTSHTGFQQTS